MVSIAGCAGWPFAPPPPLDHRAWQHGLDLVRVGSRHLLVWSSAGNPPQPVPGEEWQHDVYASWIDPYAPRLDIRTLVAAPQGQDPSSTAVNASGRILVTYEDGERGPNQRAGLWDASLKPVNVHPILVRRGGHSGHAAALGDTFLVTYGEGWVKGGGDSDRGTGDDIWARVVEHDGTLGPEIAIAVDPRRAYRDWWPVVSASDRNWLVVWQRYSTAALWGALIDAKGRVTKKFVITDDVVTDRYGVYGVRYLPSLQRYLVTGTKPGGGFAALLDTDGTVLVLRTGLPRPAPQSHVIAQSNAKAVRAVYPVVPSGVAVLDVGARSLRLDKVLEHAYRWDYMGTDGVFVTPDKVLFATLSREGVQLFHVTGIAGSGR